MTTQEQALLDDGFAYEEYRWWSFSPVMNQQDGYWLKTIGRTIIDEGALDVGIVLNSEYDTMEVYMCHCVVGCCGQPQGIHPFSIDKIQSLITEYQTNHENKNQP